MGGLSESTLGGWATAEREGREGEVRLQSLGFFVGWFGSFGVEFVKLLRVGICRYRRGYER